MSKRTNNLYCVTVARFANMVVEADSPEEAMEIAKDYKDEYLEDEDFEDSEIEIHSSDAYSYDIDYFCLEDDDYVFTKDGVFSCEDYVDALPLEDEDEE